MGKAAHAGMKTGSTDRICVQMLPRSVLNPCTAVLPWTHQHAAVSLDFSQGATKEGRAECLCPNSTVEIMEV